jgi:hypothetical protein
VRSLRGECRTTSVVILVDRQESWLIPDICDVVVVQIVETFNKFSWTSESGDEGRLVMWDKAIEISCQ